MSCFHPLPAIRKYAENTFAIGKRGQVFVPFVDPTTGEFVEPMTIPCGKCIGCRLDYSRMWADRCVLESLEYDKKLCWFLTLTYDDDHIETDERSLLTPKNTLTLYPRDITLFLKRLRDAWEYRHNWQGVRYYLCGEYGSTTARPHYHVLLFNCPVYDQQYAYSNQRGDAFYSSDELAELWGNGFIVLSDLTWENSAYTARYVLKKFKGETKDETDAYYKNAGIVPEFTRSSRRPGIARGYYEVHKDEIYKNDEIILPKGKVTKPPKYFDNLMKDDNMKVISMIKYARRNVAELQHVEKLKATDLDEDAYFAMQERHKKNSIKALTRFL